MTLKLYFHPLASFCQKVLIALYENDTPFEPHIVDLADAASAADFKKMWPIGKMPVCTTTPRIAPCRVEHHHRVFGAVLSGRTHLLPPDGDLARQTRLRDRFYDFYVHEPMQKIVLDRLRPKGKNDPYGVAQAKSLLATAYGMIDQEMAGRTWAMGDEFSMADCAAAPALFYANEVMPFADTHKTVARYFDRLMKRPSFARAVKEARPISPFFRNRTDLRAETEARRRTPMAYVDGFIVPVPKKNLAAYRTMARKAGKVWRDHGALEFRECVADDVKMGKWTSFPRSVKRKPNETVVFSYITYKSRGHRDRVNKKAMKDKRLAKMMDLKAMPFDAKRMIFGGFKVIVDA